MLSDCAIRKDLDCIYNLIKNYEAKTYKIGDSSELCNDEEKYNHLVNFYTNKITEKFFLEKMFWISFCPSDFHEEHCSKSSQSICAECWKNFLASNINTTKETM